MSLPAENANRTCVDPAIAEDWFDRLVEEVDYRCEFCDKIHVEVSELERQVKAAYATARSLRGVFDTKEIANRWLAMFWLANDALSTAGALKESNQICGVNLETLAYFHNEALEHFRLHCAGVACEPV